jgi:hypothetical protein
LVFIRLTLHFGTCRLEDGLPAADAALDSTDPDAANLLWQQLDQRVTDASPNIFTTTGKAAALVSPRLRNYTHTARLPDVRPDVGPVGPSALADSQQGKCKEPAGFSATARISRFNVPRIPVTIGPESALSE